MQYPEDYSRSRMVAVEALEHMKEHQAPWNPLNFAIWYEYVAGRNGMLIRKIDELVASHGTLPPDQAESIFLELFGQHAAPGAESGDVAPPTNVPAAQVPVPDSGSVDPLTGIGNVKQFETALDSAVAEALTVGGGLSLIMVDLDRFHAFNDSFGHNAGDEVLKFVAGTLKNSTKDHDTAARLGGNTFAIIQPRTSIAGAYVSAVAIQNTIDKKQSGSGQEDASRVISVSLGVAELKPGDTPAELMNRALGAMHMAKQQGGNRVVRQDRMTGAPTA